MSTPVDAATRPGPYFRFAQIAIAVVFAFLLLEIADQLSIIEGEFTAELALLLAMIFGLGELYAVLAGYYSTDGAPYLQWHLYLDLVIGLLFLWFLAEVLQSSGCRVDASLDCQADLSPAMRVGIVMFLAFLARDLIGFADVAHLRRKQEAPPPDIRAFMIRVGAEIAGIILVTSILLAEPDGFLGLTVTQWTWIALGVVVCYFLLKALLLVGLQYIDQLVDRRALTRQPD